MRQLATFEQSEEAQRLTDYLFASGMRVTIERDEDRWMVWVIEEDDLDRAREELTAFRENPNDEKYRAAREVADELRARELKEAKAAAKRMVNVRDQWQNPTAGRLPVTIGLLIGIAFVTIVTRSGEDEGAFYQKLTIASYQISNYYMYWDGLADVRSGEVWRLVTPIFLHGSIFSIPFLHALFNAYWLYYFGGMMEYRRGSWRLLLFVIAAAIGSNLAQYFWSGPRFGGMSGVNYGLFGYLWMKTRYAPDSGIYLDHNTIVFFVVFFFLCLTGILGPVANFAHGGGLVIGMIVGYAPKFWRDLRR
ncbi:rhomboid family intramembrane serine protease [Thalassoroseus pseudoceratinae]|uniref:rhomboid family intramembrane serine protease n=1 Tax=Thalassoroseus pseudoceratinae TaxID=2713176 RepID=UPI001420A9E2|nr:rhomboid family intramembrane serine protease [Thalassoroseus pseudoceratinae]